MRISCRAWEQAACERRSRLWPSRGGRQGERPDPQVYPCQI